jgi:Utp14 protein
MAFAGPDYEEDFNKMKDTAIDQELGIDEKRNKILVDGKMHAFPPFDEISDHGANIDFYLLTVNFSALSTVKAGWGDWAGPGATGVSTKILDIRNRLLKQVNEDSENKKRGRKDTKMPNVMISDRRIKTAAKYKISEIPHPFTTREEYERSLQMPLGGECYRLIFNV